MIFLLDLHLLDMYIYIYFSHQRSTINELKFFYHEHIVSIIFHPDINALTSSLHEFRMSHHQKFSRHVLSDAEYQWFSITEKSNISEKRGREREEKSEKRMKNSNRRKNNVRLERGAPRHWSSRGLIQEMHSEKSVGRAHAYLIAHGSAQTPCCSNILGIHVVARVRIVARDAKH